MKFNGPNGERCDGCYFWEESKSEGLGLCHRYPPTWGTNNRKVYGFDWCGEWTLLDPPGRTT